MKAVLAACLLAAMSIPFTASADEGDDRDEADVRHAEPNLDPVAPGLPEGSRRDVPDYDGRADPEATPEEIAIWVPRVILAPVRFVLEYFVREPLRWLLTTAERERWDAIQLLPFAQLRPTWGIAPTILFDFGFSPSVGMFLWVNDVVIPHNELNVHVAFGGFGWLHASLTDRQYLNHHTVLELSGRAWQRPDQLFYGLGPSADSAYTSRFGQQRLDLDLAVRVRPWRASRIRISAGVAANAFYDTDYLNQGEPPERTLTDAVDAGWFPEMNGNLPAGWPGYTAYRVRVEAALDTRQRDPESGGGGARVEAYVEHGVDFAQPVEGRWLLWGGGAGVYLDVDRGRTLGLYTLASLASPLGSMQVPFTELPDFGANLRMPGFMPGFVRGESALLSVLEYRYPVGPLFDGFVSVGVGNAFRSMFEDFAPGLLRMGFGFGFRTVGDPDQAFTMTAGLGTETFDAGTSITSVRLVLGTLRGF